MSKGSNPRPYSVDNDVFDANWEETFGKQDCDDCDTCPHKKEKEDEEVELIHDP